MPSASWCLTRTTSPLLSAADDESKVQSPKSKVTARVEARVSYPITFHVSRFTHPASRITLRFHVDRDSHRHRHPGHGSGGDLLQLDLYFARLQSRIGCRRRGPAL